MKKLVFLLLIAGIAVCNASAQQPDDSFYDLLVMNSGDSIRCRLISSSLKTFRISVPDEQGRARASNISKEVVRSLEHNYYAPRQADMREKERQNIESGTRKPGFRVHTYVGCGLRIGNIDDPVFAGNSKHTTEFVVGITPGYLFPSQKYLLGATFDFKTFGSGSYLRTYFAGPAFGYNLLSKKNNNFGFIRGAVGYIHHRQGTNGDNRWFKTETVGFQATAGYANRISHHVWLEYSLTLRIASFDDGKSNSTTVISKLDGHRSLSAVNLAIGITFGK